MIDPPQLAPASLRARVGLAWVAVIVWAAVIFSMSTATFSASLTGAALAWILKVLGIHLAPNEFDGLHFLIRKLAHLTEYGIFAVFLYHALEAGRGRGWRWRTALAAVAIAGLYSLTDEFHQDFVPGRTPTLHDCAIDTLGAAFALLILYGGTRLFQASNNKIAAASATPAEKKNGAGGA